MVSRWICRQRTSRSGPIVQASRLRCWLYTLHRHVFTCGVNPKIRGYIGADMHNSKPFDEIRHRDLLEMRHSCGFPCQPSVLHTNPGMLCDPRANTFFTMLDSLRVCLPAIAIVEHVLGIRIVLEAFTFHFRLTQRTWKILSHVPASSCAAMWHFGVPLSWTRWRIGFHDRIRTCASLRRKRTLVATAQHDKERQCCVAWPCPSHVTVGCRGTLRRERGQL